MSEEPEFLSGLRLGERIREICVQDTVDCAVAFLGVGMKDELFSQRGQKVRIVCDIAMGCTSKKALQEFGAPSGPEVEPNPNLHVRDWLHAKVYLSTAGVIIGSPNMSAKALGVLDRDPGNLEAGVFHPFGSLVWNQTSEWLNDLFENSGEVNWKDVERASSYSRDPGRVVESSALLGLSLLDRVCKYPEIFEHVTFIVTTEDLKAQTEAGLLEGEPSKPSVDAEVVVWDEDKPWLDVEKLIIGFHRDDLSKKHVDGYIRCHSSGKQDCLLAFGTKDWQQLRKSIDQFKLTRTLSHSDWNLIEPLWRGEQSVFSAAEFASALTAGVHN